ncbi:hypothetical protein RND81_01G143600 [Saponaria officinalis]|uniref:non-specific serine/threonine protein kinase n=1 Tax=Saponaria officinalis TaxID=3572 RepID=A0AAW1NFA4_SAPOF
MQPSFCDKRKHLLLMLLICSVACSYQQKACNPQDEQSLLKFVASLSSSLRPLDWNSTSDCCTSWEGVVCDDKGNVKTLWLSSRGLKGSIPSSIGDMMSLSLLNLSYNAFLGSIPHGIFSSLSSLQIIDLSSNQFSGEIEDDLFILASNLTSFNVSNNGFTGKIPASICSSCTSVKTLDFSTNKFDDQIPIGLGKCSKLKVLRAGFNRLSGILPTDVYSIKTLVEFSAPVNNISGNIAEEVVNLTNLKILELYSNNFSGVIPRDIGKLSNLKHLELHINKLKGFIPTSLLINCTNLEKLILRVNSLQGNISGLDFSRLVRLKTLDLGNNNFTGNLPGSIFSCKSLTAIRVAGNGLKGSLSPNFMALTSLTFLSVSSNQFTNFSQTIKILAGCRSLTTLILSKNFYYETLPSEIDFIDTGQFRNLQVLALGGCSLRGKVPAWLVKIKTLEAIDLSYNNITGVIPDWLGTLPKFFYLDLSMNHLSGEFPWQLSKLPALISKSVIHELNGTYLDLPVFVIPNNATKQQYNQLENLPPAIYIKGNQITGNIPAEIGRLQNLYVLDLSDNHFSGSIPPQLSNLSNLETLDLSQNNLANEIPTSLQKLHFLSKFNVAYNNLEGPILTGGQFGTFTESSYVGNSKLCGQILEHHCSDQSASSKSPLRRIRNKKLFLGITLGVFFSITAILLILTRWMICNRKVLTRNVTNKFESETDSECSNSHEAGANTSLVVVFPSSSSEIKDLSFLDILKSTNNFSKENIVGCGGFGLVYRGNLENGTKLAIKKLSGDTWVIDREFESELKALSVAQHENLISLLGYCVHDDFRLLIYYFMENGSLDYWLHENPEGPSILDWPIRLKIAIGASEGLAYMHEICEPHIVHRDIKSSNILLDENFKAYVADFGLSRLILPSRTHVTTELVGTLGYIPPEYGQSWGATLRGDVYSFGVVLLELLTGKRPVELCNSKTSEELVLWVQRLKSEGKHDEIFDTGLTAKGHEQQEMMQVLEVACKCIKYNPLDRPTIKEVVDHLKNVGCYTSTALDTGP